MLQESNEVLATIRRITAALIDVDPVRIVPAAKWADFGADRFDFMGVLRNVQKHYSIEIPDDDAFEMETVGQLIAFVLASQK